MYLITFMNTFISSLVGWLIAMVILGILYMFRNWQLKRAAKN